MLQAPIQHSDGGVAQPAHHPPSPGRHLSADIVVNHNLLARLYSPQPYLSKPGISIRQRMSAAVIGWIG
jgi:hypothetical protein